MAIHYIWRMVVSLLIIAVPVVFLIASGAPRRGAGLLKWLLPVLVSFPLLCAGSLLHQPHQHDLGQRLVLLGSALMAAGCAVSIVFVQMSLRKSGGESRSLIASLRRVPTIGLFAHGFAVPRWAKCAFNSLIICCFIVITDGHSANHSYHWWHYVYLAIVGLFVALVLIVGLAGIFSVTVYLVARLFGRVKKPNLEGLDLSLRKAPAAIPDLLLFIWGALYLMGREWHAFNRMALVTWILYILIGCLAGLGRGFGHWRRAAASSQMSV